MIYTVTLNPAVDYVMHLDNNQNGSLKRSNRETFFVGGKGINVSIMLKRLGLESTALGFVAGFTGEYVSQRVKDLGIKDDFIKLNEGFTRINVKLKSQTESEINGAGPLVDKCSAEKLIKQLAKTNQNDIVVFSGSAAKGLETEYFDTMLQTVTQSGAMLCVDCSGKNLTDCLKFNPFLIKPNHIELGEVTGLQINDYDSAVEGAEKLKKRGAKNVLVSMGKDGAVLIDQNGEKHIQQCPKGKLVNSVGAGDSTVAGFIAGYSQTGDFKKALRLGVTAGSATAFCEDLATYEDIQKLM